MFEIDGEPVKLIRRSYRLEGLRWADLWVEIDGLDRFEMCRVVAEVAAMPHEGTWTVLRGLEPTERGILLVIDQGAQWLEIAHFFADQLDARGFSGRITGPPYPRTLFTVGRRIPEGYFPAALLRYPIQPSLADGPVNVHGLPQRRWGVTPADTAEIVETGIRWLSEAGPSGDLQSGGMPTPITREDVADLIRVRQDNIAHSPLDATLYEDLDELVTPSRTFGLDEFGEVSYLEVAPEVTPAATGSKLAELIADRAERLTFAAVAPQSITASMLSTYRAPHWRSYYNLWETHVPNVYGIQLLNGRQKARARDLSEWEVTQVGQDRWLVQAHDLAPWLDPKGPIHWHHPKIYEQALADFGDLIVPAEYYQTGLPPVLLTLGVCGDQAASEIA